MVFLLEKLMRSKKEEECHRFYNERLANKPLQRSQAAVANLYIVPSHNGLGLHQTALPVVRQRLGPLNGGVKDNCYVSPVLTPLESPRYTKSI